MNQRIVRIAIILTVCAGNIYAQPTQYFAPSRPAGVVSLSNARSIQDLIDTAPRRIRVRAGVLNLNNLGISSLDGLDNVPGIETVRVLKLSNNRIKSIKSGDLASAVNLRGLGLTGNGIEEIEPNAFAGLNKLWVLNLNSNNIRRVPRNGLNGLNTIKILAIGDNPIMANEINSLYAQIPSVWKIMSVPITRANLKRLGIGAAAVVGVALAVAGVAIGAKKAMEKRRDDVLASIGGQLAEIDEKLIKAYERGEKLSPQDELSVLTAKKEDLRRDEQVSAQQRINYLQELVSVAKVESYNDLKELLRDRFKGQNIDFRFGMLGRRLSQLGKNWEDLTHEERETFLREAGLWSSKKVDRLNLGVKKAVGERKSVEPGVSGVEE